MPDVLAGGEEQYGPKDEGVIQQWKTLYRKFCSSGEEKSERKNNTFK